MPEEPASPEPPLLPEPTRELLLAQALDACIQAERRIPGSAEEIIARQPVWSRGELRRLVNLADSLDAVATNAVMSEDFRVSARRRLMHRIGALDSGASSLAQPRIEPLRALPPSSSAVASTSARQHQHTVAWYRSARLWRTTAAVFAAALTATATLTAASAASLPGEGLYSLKQAREELGVRLAADDQARALALLGVAQARLDETSRLLQLGRTDAALETTLQYDQIVERATSTYVVTVDQGLQDSPAGAVMDARLSHQQEELRAIMQTAPAPAQADLREALLTTERGRAQLADPRRVDRALNRDAGNHSSLAAAAPIAMTEATEATDELTAAAAEDVTPVAARDLAVAVAAAAGTSASQVIKPLPHVPAVLTATDAAAAADSPPAQVAQAVGLSKRIEEDAWASVRAPATNANPQNAQRGPTPQGSEPLVVRANETSRQAQAGQAQAEAVTQPAVAAAGHAERDIASVPQSNVPQSSAPPSQDPGSPTQAVADAPMVAAQAGGAELNHAPLAENNRLPEGAASALPRVAVGAQQPVAPTSLVAQAGVAAPAAAPGSPGASSVNGPAGRSALTTGSTASFNTPSTPPSVVQTANRPGSDGDNQSRTAQSAPASDVSARPKVTPTQAPVASTARKPVSTTAQLNPPPAIIPSSASSSKAASASSADTTHHANPAPGGR